MKEISKDFDAKLNREDVKEVIYVIDEELDNCIKKLRNAVYGREVRTFITEYEELMLKKADLVAWEFLKKEKEGCENSEESPQTCCRDCASRNTDMQAIFSELSGKDLKRQGIMIKAVGLTEKERKIIEEAMRKIKYGRKKGSCPSLPYLMELK